jgi:hypothetical protein
MKLKAIGFILFSFFSYFSYGEKLYTVMVDANGNLKAPKALSGTLTNSSIVDSFFFNGILSNVTLIGSSISNVNVGVGTISNATIYGGEAFGLSISNSVIKNSLITNSTFHGNGAAITNINSSNVNGLKSMAFQNSNSVIIAGGTLTDVSISGDGSGLTNLFKGVGTTGLITTADAPGNKFLRDDGEFAIVAAANATNVFWEDVQLKPDVLINSTPVVIGGNNSNNFSAQVKTAANRTQQLEFYDGNNQKLFLRNSQPDLQAKLWSSNSLVIDSANDVVIPPLVIGKNRLINGGFEFMERNEGSGFVPLGNDTYGGDRFYFLSTADDSFFYERVSNPFDGAIFAGQIINDGLPARFGMAQIVESVNCQDLRGKSVTFSGWLKTSANATNQVAILEWKGTADSVTSDVVNNWASHDYNINAFFINSADLLVGGVNELETIANTWTKFSVSANLTSEANNVIVFVFGEDNVPSLFTYQYANFQLEKGSLATSFEYRPSTLEFQLCQRYLQRFSASVNNGVLANGLVASTSLAQILFPLMPMRVTPSVNGLNPGDWRIKDGSVTNSSNNITLSSASNRGIVLNVATAATLTLGRACYMMGATANRPILFSSEL